MMPRLACAAGLLASLWAAAPRAFAQPQAPPGEGNPAAAPAPAPPAAEPPADRAREAKPRTDLSERREEILAKLDNLKITLEFSDSSLQDAIDFISSFSSINFMIDPKVRERYTDEQLKVSLKVRDIPLKSALKLMLSGKNLGAAFREGVIVIVLKEDLDKEVVLRIYDVRDLLMKVEDFAGPTIELKPPSQQGGGMRGADFIIPTESKGCVTEEFIVEMVKNNCGGASWNDNPNVSISLNSGLLIVVHNNKTHGEILRLVGLLRQYK